MNRYKIFSILNFLLAIIYLPGAALFLFGISLMGEMQKFSLEEAGVLFIPILTVLLVLGGIFLIKKKNLGFIFSLCGIGIYCGFFFALMITDIFKTSLPEASKNIGLEIFSPILAYYIPGPVFLFLFGIVECAFWLRKSESNPLK